jgi:16S rRNA (guanine527-N7)-methyltransferase
VKHPMPSVSRETRERLETYAALLLRWNRTINLISRGDEDALWPRHIDDALALVPLLPPEFAFGADLGSGAGLPGLVLAIATGRPFHLVESDQRKAAFLREAARETGAAATVHAQRIEQCSVRGAPVVTARALAPLSTLLAWAAPLLAEDGVCLFPKGRGHASELTAASAQWHMHVESFPSPTDPAAVYLRIKDIKRVGPAL